MKGNYMHNRDLLYREKNWKWRHWCWFNIKIELNSYEQYLFNIIIHKLPLHTFHSRLHFVLLYLTKSQSHHALTTYLYLWWICHWTCVGVIFFFISIEWKKNSEKFYIVRRPLMLQPYLKGAFIMGRCGLLQAHFFNFFI